MSLAYTDPVVVVAFFYLAVYASRNDNRPLQDYLTLRGLNYFAKLSPMAYCNLGKGRTPPRLTTCAFCYNQGDDFMLILR
jgi:hypothetical protein